MRYTPSPTLRKCSIIKTRKMFPSVEYLPHKDKDLTLISRTHQNKQTKSTGMPAILTLERSECRFLGHGLASLTYLVSSSLIRDSVWRGEGDGNWEMTVEVVLWGPRSHSHICMLTTHRHLSHSSEHTGIFNHGTLPSPPLHTTLGRRLCLFNAP